MEKNSYEILSGNTVVAVWRSGDLTVKNEELLPLFLKRISNADLWLQSRAIDSHRANSRLLKKALRMKEKDDISTVIYVNAATVTDNYWVRDIGSSLTYDDIKFSDDYFSSLALKGTYKSFNRAASSKKSKTPELTNTGSFEKCWKLRNGRWWLCKRANHSEMFSELFVYELGRSLGMNMAIYERGEGCVKSLDFTNGASVNFEPAYSFMGDDEDYVSVVNKLNDLCPKAIVDYIKLIYMDTITANPDRRTNNFGLLRDIKTGKLICLAPNYDNNMALISRGYPGKPKPNDLLISLFNDLINEFPEYKKYIPSLDKAVVSIVIKKLNMKVKSEEIIRIVTSRDSLIMR